MDKQYKEWLQDQTFETLATDNYNVKLLLLAEQDKNKKLESSWGAIEESHTKLENENKKLVEALEDCKTDTEPTSINWRLLQINETVKQVLNEVNNAK